MLTHDWTKVDAVVVHHFQHSWLEEIKRSLNEGLLPESHDALVESCVPSDPDIVGLSDMAFYRRKQNRVAVRHISGDRVVAMVEVVSPGNKSSRHAIRSFVEKAAELFDRRIHLLILDLIPPVRAIPREFMPRFGRRLIWEEITGKEYTPPAGKPLTLAAYETEISVKAYVETLAVGDTLEDMPLFLRPHAHVPVPLEKTYSAAFAAVPKRWRAVLEK